MPFNYNDWRQWFVPGQQIKCNHKAEFVGGCWLLRIFPVTYFKLPRMLGCRVGEEKNQHDLSTWFLNHHWFRLQISPSSYHNRETRNLCIDWTNVCDWLVSWFIDLIDWLIDWLAGVCSQKTGVTIQHAGECGECFVFLDYYVNKNNEVNSFQQCTFDAY